MDETQAEALREALIPTGERQYGRNLEEIKRNHLVRYQWAADRLEDGDRVLDAACGIGYGTAMLAKAGRRATGLEVNSDVVLIAKYWYGDGEACSFECAELHSWTGQSEGYDVVVSFETIEHLVCPDIFLCAAWECLKPGGRLYFSTPNADVEEHRLEGNPFHLRHYTALMASGLARSCGFTVDCIWSQVGGLKDSRIVHADATTPGRFWVLECTKRTERGAAAFQLERLHDELPRKFHAAFIDRCRTIRSLQQ